MRSLSIALSSLALGFCIAFAQTPGAIETKVASSHPMIYLLSLPKNWRPGKVFPVVVAIESANRDFPANMMAFEKARGDMPFILVVPEVVTNGGPRYRESPNYGYKDDDWARISRDGEWKFDEDGLAAVIDDVHRLYGGEKKFYLTGWEAGAHTAFAMAFNHRERLYAVAPVCPNYAARHVSFPNSKYNGASDIRIFAGSADPAWAPGQPLFEQAKRAETEGKAHGFEFSRRIIAGAGHGPLAKDVLGWFRYLIESRPPR